MALVRRRCAMQSLEGKIFVHTPGIVSPVVPLPRKIMEVRIEFFALGGVYLRAVLFDVAGSQSVEADRPKLRLFCSGQENSSPSSSSSNRQL